MTTLITILAAAALLAPWLLIAQTPLLKLGPYQTKAITNRVDTNITITLRPWKNVPAPFVTPANVSTNPLKQGWQRWSRSDACSEMNRIVTVRRGMLTNWVLYEMGMVWNPADTYSEFLPETWEYKTRVNLGRLVTNREVDRISYPTIMLNVNTGWHRVEFTTNLRDWTLEQVVLGPTQLVCDIDERRALTLWRAVK